MKRKLFLIALIVLISIPSAIFPSSTNAGKKDKVILWTRYLGGTMFDYGPCITDGQLVFTSTKQMVRCFDATSGENLWNKDFDAPYDLTQLYKISIALGKENIIAASQLKLSSLDKSTGKILWETSLKTTSNVEIVGSNIFVATTQEIAKIDIKTGKIVSKTTVPDKEGYRFLNVVDGNRVIVSNMKGLCKLVNLTKGTVIWENSKHRNDLWEKPIISGKNLVVPGMMMRSGNLQFIDIASGLTIKEDSFNTSQIDSTDGRVISSHYCYDTGTLEPLWETGGDARFFDCFDAVTFWNYGKMEIRDWSGKQLYKKTSQNQDINWCAYFDDGNFATPARCDGSYYFTTQTGYLVAYGNKPEHLSFRSGDDFITADGKKFKLSHKPFKASDGQIMVDPRGFLEPLGWVSSHYDPYAQEFVVYHNYEKLVAVASSTEDLYKPIMDKIIPATKTDDGTLMIPFDTMISEFGLTSTKDGDKYKLSYPRK